ncbi:MAG: MopE-related protein [Persicimonas sp.]
MARSRPLIAALIALTAIFIGSACSSDDGGQISCDADELYDHVAKTCVERPVSEPDDAGADGQSDGADGDAQTSDRGDADADADGGSDGGDGSLEDAADAEADIDLEECDKDNDGALAESCGGYDCDDNDPLRSPNHSEICDEIDNNCSGEVNDNIDCSFYAHSYNTLYEVDPFAKTATEVQTGLPSLQDIDTHPDGTLFGITRDGLYRFDEWADDWVHQGDFGIPIEDPNGLAIDSDGTAFITAGDTIYSADLHTGAAQTVGSTGSFYSSGDCVVNKRDTLFMTSKEDGQPDELVQVSRQTGEGEAVGPTGFTNIFALTAAWGKLYGLTADGELVFIDQQTGEASLIHEFSDMTFWGAASTPNR